MSTDAARKSAARDRIMVENLGKRVTELVTQHPKLKDKPIVTVLAPVGFMHQAVYRYLHDQPASEEKVVASAWIGTGYLPVEDQVLAAYAEGGSPTREQLIETLGVYVFSTTIPSTIRPGEAMYRSYSRHSRYDQDIESLVALESIKLMKDSEEGQMLMVNRLRGDRSSETVDQMLGYMHQANQHVQEATGKSIDLSRIA